MANIDYDWTDNDKQDAKLVDYNIGTPHEDEDLSTRNNIQVMRRLFHMFNGCAIATLYLISFSHTQMIHLLGLLVSALYIFEQIRINYPEKAAKFLPMTRFIIRAEEQLKESAMVPFGIAVLLTIITFPKPMAIVGIYTLAIADPMSAIIGIRFGKHKIVANRSIEGSLAFFVVTFVASFAVMSGYLGGVGFLSFIISFSLAFFCALFEMIPLKIDDNITIPLFTASTLWIICATLGVSL